MAGSLRLRPWRAGDEDAFEPRADFAAEREVNAWDWSKGPPGLVWTLLRGEEVVGIAGARRDALGWHVWAQTAELAPREWVQAIPLAAKVLDYLAGEYQATRLHAMAILDRPAAIRCLQRLGFQGVAVAPDHRLKRDYLIMRREA